MRAFFSGLTRVRGWTRPRNPHPSPSTSEKGLCIIEHLKTNKQAAEISCLLAYLQCHHYLKSSHLRVAELDEAFVAGGCVFGVDFDNQVPEVVIIVREMHVSLNGLKDI